MMTLRPSQDRGQADHSFSFAEYRDRAHIGWGNLLVINEDHVAPGAGFGSHGHRDMEITSYVLEGELAYRDNMGNVKGIPPCDVQRMSAGTGVVHSEFNHAPSQTTHFLQVWISPNQMGIAPSHEQKTVPIGCKRGRLALIASPVGGNDAVQIHVDASVYAGLFDGAEQATLALDVRRKAYVHLVRGELSVNGQRLTAGDALKIADEAQLNLHDGHDAEVLVFELAP